MKPVKKRQDGNEAARTPFKSAVLLDSTPCNARKEKAVAQVVQATVRQEAGASSVSAKHHSDVKEPLVIATVAVMLSVLLMTSGFINSTALAATTTVSSSMKAVVTLTQNLIQGLQTALLPSSSVSDATAPSNSYLPPVKPRPGGNQTTG